MSAALQDDWDGSLTQATVEEIAARLRVLLDQPYTRVIHEQGYLHPKVTTSISVDDIRTYTAGGLHTIMIHDSCGVLIFSSADTRHIRIVGGQATVDYVDYYDGRPAYFILARQAS